jgi:hypothetical protein
MAKLPAKFINILNEIGRKNDHCPSFGWWYQDMFDGDRRKIVYEGYAIYYSVIKSHQAYLDITWKGLWARFLHNREHST